MTTVVRFAPSPTGDLHLGNVRTALINFLLAVGQADNFILRYDDTDQQRSKREYVDGIARDLRWLGLSWTREVHQSQRGELYEQAKNALAASGRLYPCYETPDELDRMRRRQSARGRPPIYDRSALRLTNDQKTAFEAQGRQPHWRFKLTPGEMTWDDLICGSCRYNPAHMSDPIVVRGDGVFLYMLPSVVDDIDLGVTCVARGEDHVVNSSVQIQLFEALGATAPTFAHAPLLTDKDGRSLSKRLASLSVKSLRDQGFEAMAINNLLIAVEGGEPAATLEQLVQKFDVTRVKHGAARFDPHELERLNRRLISALPWEQARERLRPLHCEHADEAFWHVVRPNLDTIKDAAHWHTVVYGPMTPVRKDTDFLAQAKALLPEDPWDDTTWERWTDRVGNATRRSGARLFMPLRLALTGLERGPELKTLLPLLGRARVLERLG